MVEAADTYKVMSISLRSTCMSYDWVSRLQPCAVIMLYQW
jgi:hypothetical protein